MRWYMGGRGSKGGAKIGVQTPVVNAPAPGSKEYIQNHFASKGIIVDDSMFDSKIDSKIRSDYFNGIDTISDDFELEKGFTITHEDIVKKTGRAGAKYIVGYSNYDDGKLVINDPWAEGRYKYGKGNGDLSWHSAHEYSHQIQSQMMKKKDNAGGYASRYDYVDDINEGIFTFKPMIM